MKNTFLILSCLCFLLTSCGGQSASKQGTNKNQQVNNMSNNNDTTKVVKSEEEWKKLLTPEQYAVMREKIDRGAIYREILPEP